MEIVKIVNNENIAAIEAKKLHKITEKKKKKHVLRRYNSSSSGTKSKHRVECIGVHKKKNGKNGKYMEWGTVRD